MEQFLFKDALCLDIRRVRTRRAFRGLKNSNYHLETKLQRGVQKGNREERERVMFRQFRKYAHRDLEARGNVWHWLSIAQHHGLPTRLLDWTNSPLVALHFATVDTESQEDAAIWSVDFEAVNDLVPKELFPREERQGRVFTVDELDTKLKTLSDLETEGKKHGFMAFFEPPSIDDRIVHQYALFSMLSSAEEEPEAWLLRNAPQLCRKVLISADLKPEIRDRLDMMNITERVLVPGLDGLAQWLGL